jgi:hypothetical protein
MKRRPGAAQPEPFLFSVQPRHRACPALLLNFFPAFCIGRKPWRLGFAQIAARRKPAWGSHSTNKETLMKLLIWVVTGFLAMLWTAAAALLAAGVNWLATSSVDPAIREAQAMAQWPVPEWLAVWMPAGIIEPLKASITGLLDSLVSATTWIAPMLGWLSPVIWVIWGLVLALMLVLAGGAHLLVGRSKPRLTA